MATRLTTEIPGTSMFFFGTADEEGRHLVRRRKEVKWYNNPANYSTLSYDIGQQPSNRYGLTGGYH